MVLIITYMFLIITYMVCLGTCSRLSCAGKGRVHRIMLGAKMMAKLLDDILLSTSCWATL